MRTLALFCLATSGCVGGVADPTPPPPVPEPAVVAEAPVIEDAYAPLLRVPTAEEAAPDDLVGSPVVRDPEFRARVEWWVEYWQTSGARWFPDYLERMSWFSQTVDSALAARELPRSLRYLPIVESGYSPRAVSSANAAGLWQFMAPTARGMGMSVTPLIDERRNPIKSTDAALDYLGELHGRFGSWFLALAAYNAGPARVERILNRYAPLTPRSDSLFWSLRRYLPRETRDFVPKLFGAIEIASNPGTYGYEAPEQVAFLFDEVAVPDATTLDVVAEAAETSLGEIERLNPEVFRGITPPGRRTVLRVPAGRALVFATNYALIPPDERVTFLEHRVANGETLSHIALRYGIRLRDLEAANPGVRPRYLQIGQRLTVPIAPSDRRASGR